MAEHGVVGTQKLWVGSYNLSGAMNAIRLGLSVRPQPDTAMGHDTESSAPGLGAVALACNGYVNTAAENAVYADYLGQADVPVTVGVEAGADGEVAYFFRALHSEYELGAAVGEMFAFSVSAVGSGGHPTIRGMILKAGTLTSTGNGTAYQVGAVGSTQKVYAALHVLAASASDTLDVIIESADLENMAGATTRFTFTQATAITSQYMTPVAVAITDDWWRVGYTIGGADTSFTFVVVLGIK